jgi:hypothetical protein
MLTQAPAWHPSGRAPAPSGPRVRCRANIIQGSGGASPSGIGVAPRSRWCLACSRKRPHGTRQGGPRLRPGLAFGVARTSFKAQAALRTPQLASLPDRVDFKHAHASVSMAPVREGPGSVRASRSMSREHHSRLRRSFVLRHWRRSQITSISSMLTQA